MNEILILTKFSFIILLFYNYCNSSLISTIYFKKDKIQIESIDSIIKIKDILFIHSGVDLYKCKYSDYECYNFTTIKKNTFLFNFENNLLLLNNDEVSLIDLNNYIPSQKPNVTFNQSFDSHQPITSAILNRNNTLIFTSQDKLNTENFITTLKFPVYESYRNINAYKNKYVFSTLQISNGLLVSTGPESYGSIKVWNVSNNYNLIFDISQSSYVRTVPVELSNGILASANIGSGFIQLWDPMSFKLINQTKWSYISNIDGIIESSRANLLSRESERVLKLWKVVAGANGSNTTTIDLVVSTWEKTDWISKLIKISEGIIAVGCYNGTIIIYNTVINNNFTIIKELKGHNKKIAVMLNFYKDRLVSADDNGLIKIWDPTNNFTLVDTLEGEGVDRGVGISDLLQLSNGWLISLNLNGNVTIFVTKSNVNKFGYDTLYKFHAHSSCNFMCSLTELSNGMLITFSSSETFNKVWNPKEQFKLVAIFPRPNGSLKNHQLSNGDLITEGGNGNINIYKIHNLHKLLIANHTIIDNILEISNGFMLSYFNNTLCKFYYNYVIENYELDNCILLESEITNMLMINETCIVFSDSKGNVILYDLKNFQSILIKNINKETRDHGIAVDESVYIKKMKKFESGELIAISNVDEVLVLNEFNLEVINIINEPSNISNSKAFQFIEFLTNENDFTSFKSIYSNGVINSIEFDFRLYLNNKFFTETIQIKDILHPRDIFNDNKIKIEHIPKCLTLYEVGVGVGKGKQIKEGFIVNQNINLNYELSSPFCEKDDSSLLLLTNYPYDITIYPRDPPTYSLKEIDSNTSGVNLFKDIDKNEIRKIIFQRFTFGKIIYTDKNSSWIEIEPLKEYDSNLEFSIVFDFKLDESIYIFIPFILKDIYGITSDVINLKINIIRTVPWYKHWYSIAIMIFAIIGGLYKFYKWIRQGSHIKCWAAFCRFLKFKLLCCCFKQDQYSKESREILPVSENE